MSLRICVRSPVAGSLALAVCCLLSACGGKARASDDAGAAAGGSGGGGGAAVVAGGGGGGAPFERVALEEVLPWFDGSGKADFDPKPPNSELHIEATGSPARSTLSTHNHVALLSGVEAISFSAHASASVRMLVSASHAIQDYDYFAARDAGQPWPVAPVELGAAWQDYVVPLAAMMPPETGESGGMAFFLAFIVESPAPVEVWIDDVRLER